MLLALFLSGPSRKTFRDSQCPRTDASSKWRFFFSLAGGSLSGKFQADAAKEKPEYQGNAKFTGLNLTKLIDRKDLAGVLTGLLEVKVDLLCRISAGGGRLILVVAKSPAGTWAKFFCKRIWRKAKPR